ncbi:MAG: hypothetical protein WCD16_12235 [Paracoccaceae bacterium]
MTRLEEAAPDLSGCCSGCATEAATSEAATCTLAPDGLRERLADIRRLARRARLWSERGDLTVRVAYVLAEREAVDSLIAAETECCPFLSFRLKTTHDGIVVTAVTTEHAKAAAAEVFDALEGAAAPKQE